jgi:hypothetical protein
MWGFGNQSMWICPWVPKIASVVSIRQPRVDELPSWDFQPLKSSRQLKGAMDTAIQAQRIQHIIDSYSLAGQEPEMFAAGLATMVDRYSSALVEWALAEILVQNWLRYPLPRGMIFLQQVKICLQGWVEAGAIASTLTPAQFEQILGLPAPKQF